MWRVSGGFAGSARQTPGRRGDDLAAVVWQASGQPPPVQQSQQREHNAAAGVEPDPGLAHGERLRKVGQGARRPASAASGGSTTPSPSRSSRPARSAAARAVRSRPESGEPPGLGCGERALRDNARRARRSASSTGSGSAAGWSTTRPPTTASGRRDHGGDQIGGRQRERGGCHAERDAGVQRARCTGAPQPAPTRTALRRGTWVASRSHPPARTATASGRSSARLVRTGHIGRIHVDAELHQQRRPGHAAPAQLVGQVGGQPVVGAQDSARRRAAPRRRAAEARGRARPRPTGAGFPGRGARAGHRRAAAARRSKRQPPQVVAQRPEPRRPAPPTRCARAALRDRSPTRAP